MMKTRVCRLYGQDDLRVESDTVASPGAGEVTVAVAHGGICGSDMHYLREGGIGTIRVREPIILGHEASGRVHAVGNDVVGLESGDAVAVNPSRPCGRCTYCRQGLHMHCLDMRFSGSAARLPHEQGFFRDYITVRASQCVRVPASADLGAVACAEPLAVCLHAAAMAGPIEGKRVLVTGAGPIGVLCTAVAKARGGAEIVVTDIQDAPLAIAQRMGADRTVNVAKASDGLEAYAGNKGHFDVAFECSAARSAMHGAISALKPRGTLLQVGVCGDTPLPINAIVAKEIRMQGTHRFHEEFSAAVNAIVEGELDVRPIITQRFELNDADKAFAAAHSSDCAVKVHLSFEGS